MDRKRFGVNRTGLSLSLFRSIYCDIWEIIKTMFLPYCSTMSHLTKPEELPFQLVRSREISMEKYPFRQSTTMLISTTFSGVYLCLCFWLWFASLFYEPVAKLIGYDKLSTFSFIIRMSQLNYLINSVNPKNISGAQTLWLLLFAFLRWYPRVLVLL